MSHERIIKIVPWDEIYEGIGALQLDKKKKTQRDIEIDEEIETRERKTCFKVPVQNWILFFIFILTLFTEEFRIVLNGFLSGSPFFHSPLFSFQNLANIIKSIWILSAT